MSDNLPLRLLIAALILAVCAWVNFQWHKWIVKEAIREMQPIKAVVKE